MKKRAAYYGNKVSKIVHCSTRSDACRLGEIKEANRVSFDSLDAALAAGYHRCKVCLSDPVGEVLEGETVFEE